jgi:hypothetical protein
MGTASLSSIMSEALVVALSAAGLVAKANPILAGKNLCDLGLSGNGLYRFGGGPRTATPQLHWMVEALDGSMLMPRPWRRPVRTSPHLSSKAQVKGSMSSQTEAGRHAQLSKQTRLLHTSDVLVSKDSHRVSAQACASC